MFQSLRRKIGFVIIFLFGPDPKKFYKSNKKIPENNFETLFKTMKIHQPFNYRREILI